MQPVSTLFASHGLRCTRQREAIYRVLAETMTHPTAEELLAIVRSVDPGVSLATVYNTLDVCVRHGLVRKLESTPECGRPAANGAHPARYDADVMPHMHVVMDDGQVRDIPEDLSELILKNLPPGVMGEIERRLGVRVSRVNMQFVARASEKDDEETPGSNG